MDKPRSYSSERTTRRRRPETAPPPRSRPRPRPSTAPTPKTARSTSRSRNNAAARAALEKKLRRREWFDAFFEAGIIALILFFILWPTKINGTSMEETFYSGDKVLMSRAMVYFKRLHRGDIVISRATDKTDNKDIIKRIIGLPGERVTISGGEVLIQGESLHERYLSNIYTAGDIDIFLGKDEYFLMGDNRESSLDSRDFGPVHKRQLIGKVVFRYSPLSKLKFY